MIWQQIRTIAFGILVLSALAFSQNLRNALVDRPLVDRPVKVDVDLVTVNASVTDSESRHVRNVAPEYFHVWEDKVEQKIEYLSSEDAPLSVGIILDVSGSMNDKLSKARNAAVTFLKLGNLEDEYFLIEFSDRPKIVHDFTRDISNLQNRLVFTAAKGMTSLYDAVYLGLEKLKEGTNPRKALLLITDGEDNRSRYSFSNVKQFVREQDVQVYSVGILSDYGVPGYSLSGRWVLEELSVNTGGLAFFPDSVDQLEGICSRIAAELKNQYVIGYRSSNPTKDGRWRKLQLKITPPKGLPRLSVRAKNGYYAGASETTTK